MNKILTVVIPTYNMEKYLDKCLTSLIVSKNLNEVEVLVVNDGSKDSSLQIARKYEAQYPQSFRVIDKENGNYGSCINCGLKNATGKYIKVLDADDSFNTDNFDEFIEFLKPLNVDLVISDFLIIDQSNDKQERIEYNLPVGCVFTFDYFVKKDVPYMWMHGVTHLTEKMRRIGYVQQEGISYTDKEFVFYPMAVSKTVAYFPMVVYHYLTGREGQTIDKSVWRKNYWMEEEAVKKLVCLFKEHKDEVSASGKQFMLLQGKLYIGSIYREHLRLSRGILPIQNLIDFDEWLKNEDDELYHCIDDETETANFHYVIVWREYRLNMKSYLTRRFIHRILFYVGIH
jgi:glycosyltransferase involved in cell wall biosynthesis